MSQVNRLQQRHELLRAAIHDARIERDIIANEIEVNERELPPKEWVGKLWDDYDAAILRLQNMSLELAELSHAIHMSKKTEYDRLTEKGKNQCAEILSAMYAAPENETSDYAQATGLSVERVRFLARVMARADMIVRTCHSRWNGMYYGKYYTYRVYNPQTDDLPF